MNRSTFVLAVPVRLVEPDSIPYDSDMLQTLFHIPPTWFGIPGMIVWLLLCSLWLAFVFVKDREKLKAEFLATLPIMIFGCLAIMFLLPNLAKPEVNPADPLGDPINRGLAIRGYGVMMMLAVLSGMGIVLYRGQKIGYPTEHIFRLAIWMVVCGMLGARLYFVLQYHDRFFQPGDNIVDIAKRVFDMVSGGLVVIGSMIGALLAAGFVVWKWKLPVWQTADLIAPGMALGLAIGRIGCLLNGCCWGGVCDVPLPAIEFPAGSPPYMQHFYSGELLGIETESIANDPDRHRVTNVGDGIGKELGLTVGETISVDLIAAERVRHIVGTPKAKLASIPVTGDRVGEVKVPFDKLRQTSREVHPTQIYSSVNALVLCLFLWFYWHVRRNDGEVMGLMLILYPISRFVLELIRNDESGQFGTEFTTAQQFSMVIILFGIGLFAHSRMFGKRAPLPHSTAKAQPEGH